jgi:hypothetical protein
MSRSSTTIRRRFAIVAVGLTAVALPLQAGAAHAATPDEDLSTCIDSAIATMGDGFSANVDACVQAYIQAVDAQAPAAGAVTVTDNSVNTGILGAVDGSPG